MTLSPKRQQELLDLAKEHGFTEEEIESIVFRKKKRPTLSKKEFYKKVVKFLKENNSITKEDMQQLEASLKKHSNPSVEYSRAIDYAKNKLGVEIEGNARRGWAISSALSKIVSEAIQNTPKGAKINLKTLTDDHKFLTQKDIISEFKKRGWSMVAGQSFTEDGI